MNKKIIKDPDLCPRCDLPLGICRCVKGGGGSAKETSEDEEKHELTLQPSHEMMSKPEGVSPNTTLFDEQNQLLKFTFFELMAFEYEKAHQLHNDQSADDETDEELYEQSAPLSLNNS